jgi:hypothetical protein
MNTPLTSFANLDAGAPLASTPIVPSEEHELLMDRMEFGA